MLASWHASALDALVGRRLGPVPGADAIDAGSLRRYAEALEWAEMTPDPRAAPEALPVPVAAHTAFAMPAYWRPGDRTATVDDPPALPDMPFFDSFPAGTRTFNLGFRRQPHAPAVVGERLSATYEVRGYEPMALRVGPGAVVDIVATYTGGDGSLRSEARFRLLNYVPAATEPARRAPRPRPAADGGRRTCELTIAHTVQRMIMWAGANRDFSGWHHDREYARAGGAPDIFANTFFIEALYERLLHGIGALESIDFRIASFLLPGTTVCTRANWPADGETAGDRLEVEIEQVADDVTTSWGRAELRIAEAAPSAQ